MNYLLCLMISFSSINPNTIFDFNKTSDIQEWRIVNDVVMGGKSSASFQLTPEGHALYTGNVSLKNNGGFSSVRSQLEKKSTKEYTKVILKLKGDGKPYQFRIKSNSSDYHSYVATFSTSGEWQEIEISLKDMYPSFRGRKLEQPNFPQGYIEEIAFLIGNKKEEKFKLLLDKIELQ